MDKADAGFHGMYHGRGIIPWNELSAAMCERFGEGSPREAIEKFNKLVQARSMTKYLEKFELLKH